ncbi:complement C1q tumor necrosis factor-related protein 3-like [Mercenaria mercenaria]|uniref:complement C1q tumor necrosis factor-related protein 3-like n=1 Tax=Mercenaria mercenaria TaxID=6596 RepID=UPI00234F3AF9|nr:complement C1q tumor necrosis factor-related protein 3-like [Mercenaria mercenaria]
MAFKRLRFFLLVCLFSTLTVSEPICSKFVYEEQLLEKMVRVEFNVGQTEKEIKSTNSLVLESLQQLKQTREKMTEEFEALKLEAKKMLNENEVKVSKEIDDLRAERAKTLEEYDNKIKEFGEAAVVPNIAFKARTPSSLDPDDNAVIVFTKNIVNIGNAYDNTTGIFTAPIDGAYLFTSQLCLQSGKHITFGIYIENIVYALSRYYGIGEGDYICFNIETTAVLKANQRVSVKSWSATTGNILLEEENHRWNVFSGTLIHK